MYENAAYGRPATTADGLTAARGPRAAAQDTVERPQLHRRNPRYQLCKDDVLQLNFTMTPDRKSTRLNSSHQIISYAVFSLKKKTNRPSVRLFCLMPTLTLPLAGLPALPPPAPPA